MSPKPASPLLLAGLGLIAAAYFLLSCTVTLEWVDEGHLIYQSWQVAQGAVPYRDFQHVYTPGVFLVNGLLFRVVGSDLLLIRLSLVLLKAVLAVLVYLAARRIAAPAFALVAYLAVVIVCGGPWWVFNAPYATHYALTLSVLGVLLYLRVGGRHGALLAGVAFGFAALFKQTTGLFATASLVIALCWDAALHRQGAAAANGRAGQTLRILALVSAAIMLIGYLASNNTLWNLAVLAAPLAVLLGAAFWREWRDGAAAGNDNIDAVIATGVGAAAPVAAAALAYTVIGDITDLVRNTVSGLPQVIRWFSAVPIPTPLNALYVLAAVITLVVVRRAQPRSGAAIVGLALSTGGVGLIAGVPNVSAYMRSEAWIGDIFKVVYVIPFLLTWAAVMTVLSVRARDELTRARRLMTLMAASGLLALYPSADFWHLVMAWPAFAPLLAWQLERICRRADGAVYAPMATLMAVALLLCAAPFVYAVVNARLQRPAHPTVFARAGRINDASPKMNAAADLVRYLDEQPPDRPVLGIGEGPMLNFLAGRRSALEREEFLLYLVATGFVDSGEVRALIGEQQAIDRMTRERPIIVVNDGAPSAARFRTVLPQIAAYIDEHFQPAARFGPYQVLHPSHARAAEIMDGAAR